jgi:D-aminoacyl-tRNA deacylase
MLGIVVSRQDPASVHIGDQLLESADWCQESERSYRLPDVQLREFDELHLESEEIATAFDDPDLIAIASRHAGETGPLLTAHHTGNFGEAEFGGADRSLSRAAPAAHKRTIEALSQYAPDGYEVGTECTHHGPSDVGAPSLFVELGSAEAQWEDPAGAKAVARAIFDLRDVDPDCPGTAGKRRHLVGFGGGHYAPRYERVVRETNWAVGHVAADWCLEAMGPPADNVDLIRRAFEASNARYGLLETNNDALRAAIEEVGSTPVTETWVRETSGVPLELVERAEAQLCSIADGLRFGDDIPTEPVPTKAVAVPQELLAEANGSNQAATLDRVGSVAVALVTDQGGSRLTGPVLVRADREREDLFDALVAVLSEQGREVERLADGVRIREAEFDPELAAAAGVPEGPKFGTLSAGEPVEVKGTTVDPEEVHRERTRTFKY